MKKTVNNHPTAFVWLLMLCIMQLFVVKVQAQNAAIDDWKNTKVTLRVSNEPLGKVLEKVAKQAEATIEFQEVALVGIASPTTLNVKDMPLDKVLGRLIGDQNVLIRYEVGRHIIVSSYTRDEDAKKMLHIEGVVIDAKTKETLVVATVMVTDGTQKDGVRGSITDVNGSHYKFHAKLQSKCRTWDTKQCRYK